MRCSNCDCDQFNEDETTGQLICLECGIGTGIYHGITQSQSYVETRGLRVVGKLEDTSDSRTAAAIDVVDLNFSLDPDADFTSTPMQANNRSKSRLPSPSKSGLTRAPLRSGDDLTRSFLSSHGADNDVERSIFQADQTGPPKQHYRPWRLSEPFTFILRRQAGELMTVLGLSEVRGKRLLDTAWNLWLNYLSITGEFGEAAWAHASREPIRATRILMDLCDLKWVQRCGTNALLAYLTGPVSLGSGALHGSSTDGKTDATEHRLRQFMWAGWSTLYEPSEGRENKDPFIKPLLQSHRASVAKYKRTRAERGKPGKPRTTNRRVTRTGASDSNEKDVAYSTSAARRQSKSLQHLSAGWNSPVANVEESISDHELSSLKIMSDKELVDLLRDDESGCSVSIQSKTACTRKRGRPKLLLDRRTVYRNHIIKKLLLPDPWRRVFWRGQIHGRIRCLLSHNLAILYLACLSISPIHQSVVNPIAWPHKDKSFLSIGQVALTSMVTLADLFELCKERQLTFVKARECLPLRQFAIHDQYLIPLLQPKRPPSLGMLTKATYHMIHFLGCFQLPRLPFGWLVDRSVITLGLPESMHTVCRLLLKRLRVILSHSTGLPTGPSLICSTPWSRVLRAEVTAMALVVIALRLLFKFDDLSEYRLAYVAQILKSSETNFVNSPKHTSPFDWTVWATYAERRFGRSSSTVSALHTDNTTCESEVPLRSNCVRGFDLTLLESASEFLGPYEFKVGESVGWGETVMYARKHGQAECKLALTKPLRELCTEPEKVEVASPTPTSAGSSMVSDNGPTPEMCVTQAQKDGFNSPFRKATLDFLLQANTPFSLDLLRTPGEIGLSSTQCEALASWWVSFCERRSRYVPICAWGFWTGCSTSSSDTSENKCSFPDDKSAIPAVVERLIRAHDNQLAEFLQLSAAEIPTAPHPKDKISARLPIDSGETSEVLGPTPNTVVSHAPSQSVQWLIQICATACGSVNSAQLLSEIEMLEMMLFPPKQRSSVRFRQVDLALIACLDLR